MSDEAKAEVISTALAGAHRAMNESRTVVNETLQAFVEEMDTLRAALAEVTRERDHAQYEESREHKNAVHWMNLADALAARLRVAREALTRIHDATDDVFATSGSGTAELLAARAQAIAALAAPTPPVGECSWCRKPFTEVEAKHLTVCSPCWDANCRGREAFASGTAIRDAELAKMAAPTLPVPPPGGHGRFLVLIKRDTDPFDVTAFDTEAEARAFESDAGAQWSDSYVAQVIKGPRDVVGDLAAPLAVPVPPGPVEAVLAVDCVEHLAYVPRGQPCSDYGRDGPDGRRLFCAARLKRAPAPTPTVKP